MDHARSGGRERLRTALYEARETRSNLEIAVAAGIVSEVEVDKIAATLYELVGTRRR